MHYSCESADNAKSNADTNSQSYSRSNAQPDTNSAPDSDSHAKSDSNHNSSSNTHCDAAPNTNRDANGWRVVADRERDRLSSRGRGLASRWLHDRAR